MCRVRRCGWHLGWRVSEGRRQSRRCAGQRAAQEAELLTTASPPLHNRGMARRPGPQRVERVLQLSQMLQLRRPQQLAGQGLEPHRALCRRRLVEGAHREMQRGERQRRWRQLFAVKVVQLRVNEP